MQGPPCWQHPKRVASILTKAEDGLPLVLGLEEKVKAQQPGDSFSQSPPGSSQPAVPHAAGVRTQVC